MKEIENKLKGLKIEKIQYHKNIAVAPLIGKSSALEYIVFNEAINSGLKVRETGNVPTLHFKNETGKNVLILQGEYVEGGKQNRMVASNIYMSKDFDGDVPVNCVQQGRWRYSPTIDLPHIDIPPIDIPPWRPRRRREDRIQNEGGADFCSPNRMATKNICFASIRGQHDVWGEVSRLMSNVGVHSFTSDLGEVVAKKHEEISSYVNEFSYVKDSVGIVVITEKNGNKIYGADIFDKSSTMEKYFKKLMEIYVLDAISKEDKIKVDKKDIEDLLVKIKKCSFEERKAISLGNDYRISGDSMQGSLLIYNKIPVYVSFATIEKKEEKNKIQVAGMPDGAIRTGFYR